MEDDRIAKLEKECAELRGQITALWQTLTKESADTTDHVVTLYRRVADFRSFLKPMVEKVFPGCAEAQKQLDAIVADKPKKPR